jgi:hypothetical protein
LRSLKCSWLLNRDFVFHLVLYHSEFEVHEEGTVFHPIQAGVTGSTGGGEAVSGVLGRTFDSSNAVGVAGFGTNGSGVYGNSTNKYGGDFQGGLTPLKLEPSSTSGSPTTGTHSMGEFYVDNQGVLYFCTANGTPGTWKAVMLANP